MNAEDVRKAFKYLFPDELKAMQFLTRQLPPHPLVVNIGAGSGTSGLLFLETRPDLTLITVDIQDEDSPFGCLYAERDVIKAAGLGEAYNRRWFQICADSKAFAEDYRIRMNSQQSGFMPFREADLVFVDGDHSYEGAVGDIAGWLYCIKAGGLLAVHDYQKERLFHEGDTPEFRADRPHPKPWPGVNQAVDELLVGHFEFYLHVDSLAVFRV